MDYNVVITIDAEEDLDSYLWYLSYEKQNRQAALNVLNDFEETIQRLSATAGSLQDCVSPALKKNGYKRIHFLRHRYFLLYRVEGHTVFVDRIFHELQDCENKLN